VAVQADNLALQANGDIGSLAHPFEFQLGQDGALGGSAIFVGANATRVANFIAGGDLNIASLSELETDSLLATGKLILNAGGNLVLGHIESDFNGDHAIDVTAASVMATDGTDENIVAKGANAKVTLVAETGIGSPAQYIYVDTPWISPTTVSGGIYIHALSNTTLPNLIGPGEVQLVSDQYLALGNVSVAGALDLSAGHDLTFAGLTTGANASLSAGNAIVGNSFIATGQAVVTANLGSLQIASITAADLTLTSLGDLNIPSIRIDGPVLISAPNIVAHITNGSSAPLQIDVTGIAGTAAHTANLDISSPQGVSFGDYFADTGVVSTNAGHVRFKQGNVATSLLLITPFTNLYLNNVSPTAVRNVTGQLFAPGKFSFLDQDGTTTLTDAYFVQFGDGFSALMIGRNGNVVPAMNLMQAGLSGIILTDPWFGEPTDFGNPDQWIISLDGGLAVNTGGQP
jgi:hypothetical protein